MRSHLIKCLELGKMLPFPKYRNEDTTKPNILQKPDSSQSQWSHPRSKTYNLRSSQCKSPTNSNRKNITLSNRFSALSPGPAEKTPSKPLAKISSHQITQVVHNISNVHLSSHEMNLLEKGLNFCPSSKDINAEELLDDTFNYCRNLRLKHYFATTASNGTHNSSEESVPVPEETEKDDERCEMKSKCKNPYFCASSNFSAPSLEKYLSTCKSNVRRIAKIPNKVSSNLSPAERATLDELKKRTDLIITRADKGGKVVVLDKQKYIEHCESQLDNPEFYEKINTDPNEGVAKDIRSEIINMTKKNN